MPHRAFPHPLSEGGGSAAATALDRQTPVNTAIEMRMGGSCCGPNAGVQRRRRAQRDAVRWNAWLGVASATFRASARIPCTTLFTPVLSIGKDVAICAQPDAAMTACTESWTKPRRILKYLEVVLICSVPDIHFGRKALLALATLLPSALMLFRAVIAAEGKAAMVTRARVPRVGEGHVVTLIVTNPAIATFGPDQVAGLSAEPARILGLDVMCGFGRYGRATAFRHCDGPLRRLTPQFSGGPAHSAGPSAGTACWA